LGYEYPLHTAQTYVYAYQISHETFFLELAENWAKWIISEPPETGCKPNVTQPDYEKYCAKKGTYAEHYGRVISFFIHLYAMTKKNNYLDNARKFAQIAVSKLYYQGLFRGHPMKPYYGSIDGVGILMYALLELNLIRSFGEDVLGNNAIIFESLKGLTFSYDNF
jgi:rhamnogalacturonyl hydrolase YesR